MCIHLPAMISLRHSTCTTRARCTVHTRTNNTYTHTLHVYLNLVSSFIYLFFFPSRHYNNPEKCRSPDPVQHYTATSARLAVLLRAPSETRSSPCPYTSLFWKKKITTRVNYSLSSCNIFPSIRVVRVRVPEWPFFLCSVGGAYLRLNSTRSPHDDDLSPALPVDHCHVFGLLQHRHRRRCHWPLRPKHLRHLRVFARQCSAYNGQLHVFEYNQDKGISISCIYICYFISLCTINRGVKVMLKLCDKKKNV